MNHSPKYFITSTWYPEFQLFLEYLYSNIKAIVHFSQNFILFLNEYYIFIFNTLYIE